MLKKLTLIIPTYCRQQYAIRAMRYWSKLGITTHIIDGSNTPIANTHLIGLNSNVFYHHIPHGFMDRLKISLNFLNTEYCALCGDDEFFLESGITASIETLEKNMDLIACAGKAVGFYYKDQELYLKSVYPEFNKYSVYQDIPYQRMLYHMRHYTPSTMYSIVRRDAWKHAMEVVVEKEYPVYALGELQFEMMLAYQGKSKIIDHLYWMRNITNKGIRNTDISLCPDKKFSSWWSNHAKKIEIDELLEKMTYSIISWENEPDNNVSDNDIKKSLKNSFNAYHDFQKTRYTPLYITRWILRKFLANDNWKTVDEYLENNALLNRSHVYDDIFLVKKILSDEVKL